MTDLTKTGAILSIISGALMFILGFTKLINFTSISVAAKVSNPTTIILTLFMIGLGIANIVLSSILLKTKQENIRVAAGIVAIVSVFFGWFILFFPAVLILTAGILLLAGEKKNNNDAKIVIQNPNKEAEVL